MSRIDDLIAEHCPDGFQTFTLGELEVKGLVQLGRGNVISKLDLASFPGEYPVYSSSAAGVGLFGTYGKYMFDDERITWSVDGGGRFFHREPHRYSVTNVSGWLRVLAHESLLTRYLFYVLDNSWSKLKFDYTLKAHPSVIREVYEIGLPPLEIQREIVRILDNFTQLEAELEAELEARRKQYEFYRDSLLTFGPPPQTRWATLGEVADVSWGDTNRTKSSFVDKDGYTAFSATGPDGQMRHYDYDREGVVLSAIGARCGKTWYATGKWSCIKNTIRYFSFDEQVAMNKFLFWVTSRPEVWPQNGSAQPFISLAGARSVEIPIPPLEEQQRIVDILDTFDALVNDISVGLPAELAARRKQYEYYRDRILTFPEKAA